MRHNPPVELTPLNLGLVVAAAVIAVGYVALIAVPAWRSYGRVWERLGAAFLSLYILATLLGVGLAIGGAVFWFYDRYA